MLIEILFFVIGGILVNLTLWMPGANSVPLLLPWGIDSLVITMASYYHGAIETLPYLEVVMTAFLYALLFEFALLVLKLVLGHRAPQTIN